MFLFGFDISGIVIALKILGFLLSVAFAVGIVLSLLAKLKLAEEEDEKYNNHFIKQKPNQNKENIRWNMIVGHFQSKNSAEWRAAIIDADTMLEDIITQLGYSGATFGEKLKSIRPTDFPYINEAWEVHKLRNIIAHQGTGYHLNEREAYRAYKIYEEIFYSSGYLS